MTEISWQEFSKSDRIVSKRREFKTPEAAERFLEKLYDKDNFYRVLGTR